MRIEVRHGTPIEEFFGYSTGASQGDLVFVSGQLARDANGGQIQETDLRSKHAKVVSNIELVLRKLDCSLTDTVVVNVHADARDSEMTELLGLVREGFGHLGAAITVIPIDRLNDDGGRVEISAIAVRSEG